MPKSTPPHSGTKNAPNELPEASFCDGSGHHPKQDFKADCNSVAALIDADMCLDQGRYPDRVAHLFGLRSLP